MAAARCGSPAKLLAPRPAAPARPILILLDDVTDRRTLERALSGAQGKGERECAVAGSGGPPPVVRPRPRELSASERRTFEALAAAILKGPRGCKPAEAPRAGEPPLP
jgi:hypothetical protein